MDTIEIINRLIECAECLEEKASFKRLKFWKEKLESIDFVMAFLGETGSGKSTIINSLIKKDIIPTRSIPTNGAMVEVSVDDIEKYSMRNSKGEFEIDKEKFKELVWGSENPDTMLCVNIKNTENFPDGFRLYDTPGYNSLSSKHEQALLDFIPNIDIIIYVLDYTKGFQRADEEFCQVMKSVFYGELPNTIFLINRLPEGISTKTDKRIKEMHDHIKDILPKPSFLFSYVDSVDFEKEIYWVNVPGLKEEFENIFSREERQKAVEMTVQLLSKAEKDRLEYLVDSIAHVDKMDREAINSFTKRLKEFDDLLDKGEGLINETMVEIKASCNRIVNSHTESLTKEVAGYLANSNSLTDFESGKNYITESMVPRAMREMNRAIYDQVSNKVEELDEKLHGLIMTAVDTFTLNISIKDSQLKKSVQASVEKIAKRLFKRGSFLFFKHFGGRGGAGAGVANFGKKALKGFGRIFGKRFSRESHNALAKFLKKIGATSAKKLAIYLEAIIEIFEYLIQVGRYKRSITNKIKKINSKTREDLNEDVNIFAKESKAENLQFFRESIEEFKNPYEKAIQDKKKRTKSVNFKKATAILENINFS